MSAARSVDLRSRVVAEVEAGSSRRAAAERFKVGVSSAIRAFRMTDKVDVDGYFVLDRHALVTLQMRGVTGLKLEGDAGSIISDLTIRRWPGLPGPSSWHSCAGPAVGDIEIAFDTAVGLYGAIYTKDLSFELHPLETATA